MTYAKAADISWAFEQCFHFIFVFSICNPRSGSVNEDEIMTTKASERITECVTVRQGFFY